MLISVIIPTYNRVGKLLRAVDSVLQQSFKDFELLVVDDGSTDTTAQWVSLCEDSRLSHIPIPHKGVSSARNEGARRAKGDWLCFLDSDDVWRRHKLSEQIKYHQAHPDCVFSQTEDVWIRNSVRVNKMKKHMVREGSIFLESLRMCLVTCSSVMIQKKVFWDIGGFDEALPTCEDYDLWLRLLAHHPVGFIPKVLVTKFGGHEDQLSKAFPVMDKYRIYALEKLLKSGALSEPQKKMTLAEIEYKKNIVGRRGCFC